MTKTKTIIKANKKFIFISIPASFINYLLGLLLLNYLLPNEFGLIAKINSTLEFFLFLKAFRLDQLYYNLKEHDSDENTTYLFCRILQVFFGAILFLVFYYLYYKNIIANSDFLYLSLLYLSLQVIQSITSLYIIHSTLKWKRSMYSIIFSIAQIIGNISAIICASRQLSYWSLLIKAALPQIVILLFLIFYIPLPFSKKIKWESFKHYIRKGKHLFINNILDIFINKSDDIIIGYGISEFVLGVYSRAFQIVLLPIDLLSDNFISFNYPILLKEKNNPRKLFQKIYSFQELLLLANAFIISNIILFLPIAVQYYFGNNWKNLIPISVLLIVLSLGRVSLRLFYFSNIILEKFTILNKIYLYYALINLFLILVGYYSMGVWGVASAQSVSLIIALIIIIIKYEISLSFLIPMLKQSLIILTPIISYSFFLNKISIKLTFIILFLFNIYFILAQFSLNRPLLYKILKIMKNGIANGSSN